MKKLFAIFALMLLVVTGCSDDSVQSLTAEDPNKINPPAWIQGVWYDDQSLEAGVFSGFKFEVHDFCTILVSNTQCYADLPLEVQEYSSDDTYSITLYSNGSETSYTFYKVSPSEFVVVDGNGNQSAIYVKEP